MAKFKNKLGLRVALAKTIGFVFGLIAFFSIPHIFWETSMYLRVGVLLWYTTIWAIIGLFWVMDKHPLFNISFPFWFRWIFMWAWLNLVVVFFWYSSLMLMVEWSMFEWYSPFWFALEWAMLGLIIDYIATKYYWEGKSLLK